MIHVAGDVSWKNREKGPAYTFDSGAVYEGEWLGRDRDGFGVQTWPDRARYEGQ